MSKVLVIANGVPSWIPCKIENPLDLVQWKSSMVHSILQIESMMNLLRREILFGKDPMWDSKKIAEKMLELDNGPTDSQLAESFGMSLEDYLEQISGQEDPHSNDTKSRIES